MKGSGPRRLAVVLLAALAGCGGDAVAPGRTAQGPGRAVLEEAASQGSTGQVSTTRRGDTLIANYVYFPHRGGRFAVGQHEVSFPAYAVCDPATSGYGPGTWDLPCTPLLAPLKITAKTWTAANGMPRIEFAPDLRFRPSDWSLNWVTLQFRDQTASDSTLAELLNVLWVPPGGAEPIDERATDPTLRTYVNTRSGTIIRRIKHFSGYLVVAD